MADDTSSTGERDLTDWLKIVFGGLVGLWLISVAGGIGAWCSGGLKTLADFGGWCGMISSLFSSLALFGAIYAVLLQKQDLELARTEQRNATEAHKSNARSQDKMVKIQGLTTLLEAAAMRVGLRIQELDRLIALGNNIEKFRYGYPDLAKFPLVYIKSRFIEHFELIEEMEVRVPPDQPNRPFLDLREIIQASINTEIELKQQMLQTAKAICSSRERALEKLFESIESEEKSGSSVPAVVAR